MFNEILCLMRYYVNEILCRSKLDQLYKNQLCLGEKHNVSYYLLKFCWNWRQRCQLEECSTISTSEVIATKMGGLIREGGLVAL